MKLTLKTVLCSFSEGSYRQQQLPCSDPEDGGKGGHYLSCERMETMIKGEVCEKMINVHVGQMIQCKDGTLLFMFIQGKKC